MIRNKLVPRACSCRTLVWHGPLESKICNKSRVMSVPESPRVLSIQSHVVHGHVGNKSAVFPLQLLGFEVDSINTVQFSTHTAYQHVRGTVLREEELARLVEGLVLNGVDDYTHLITGYSRSPESLCQLADIVRKLREKNRDLVYVCDPVMGDNGKMYVPEEILPVYRDVIVPLADILTPNQFEAELITGLKMGSLQEAYQVIKALHLKGVKTVVLSSTELGDADHMLGIASSNGSCYKIAIPRFDSTFTGTGDLFAALYLAWWHRSRGDVRLALESTIATMHAVVRDTFQRAREKQPKGKLPPALLELRLVQNKLSIEQPHITIRAEPVSFDAK